MANISTGYGLQHTCIGDDIVFSADLDFLKKYLINDPDFRAMFKGESGVDYGAVAGFVNNYITEQLTKLRDDKNKYTFTYEELMELFI